jgi:hypothetical protein
MEGSSRRLRSEVINGERKEEKASRAFQFF